MVSLYACLHVPNFPPAVLLRGERNLRTPPLVVSTGKPPNCFVYAATEAVQAGGIREGMSLTEAAARTRLPGGYPAPLSIRVRLDDSNQDVDDGTVELRVKLRIPQVALRSGPSAVTALAATAVQGFERLLEDPALHRYTDSQ